VIAKYEEVIAKKEEVIAKKEEVIAKKEEVIAEFEGKVSSLQALVAQLQRMKFGQSRERFEHPLNQLSLPFEIEPQVLAMLEEAIKEKRRRPFALAYSFGNPRNRYRA
jgi:uncharacterized coiled-coil DUF342 family protein